jgi:hypothetical protein
MATPTYVAEFEGTWTTTTTPKTSASISATAGDVLVAVGIVADSSDTFSTPTNSGVAQTWTLQAQATAASFTRVAMWTCVVSTTQAMTVSLARTTGGTADKYGLTVHQYSAVDTVTPIGAANATTGSGAPALTLTTQQTDSSVLVVSADWAAVDGAVRTWNTVNGSVGTEMTYTRETTGAYTIYIDRYTDAGGAGSKSLGLSAPVGQTFSIAAVEIRGIVVASAARPPRARRVQGRSGNTRGAVFA